MPQTSQRAASYISDLKQQLNVSNFEELREARTAPRPDLPPRIPAGNDCSAQGIERRRQLLREAGCAKGFP